jgi:tRNA (guanine-N7-)-methyltransferase
VTRERPYADAPRIPEGEVDVRTLVTGAFVEIELGPGRGGFIVERATAEPSAALVGFEIRKKWAAVVDQRLSKLGFGARARVFCEDARYALPRLVPDASVRRFFAHFPDPWWKKRHQKRILLGGPVIDQIARLLERGGELFMQTDVEERALGFESAVGADPRFAAYGDAGTARLAENPYGARSPRERRATADGLPIHRLRYVRL